MTASCVVVVGDAELAQRTRELLPNFQVLGVTDDPDLGDPVTSVAPIRGLIESARPPDAVVCSGAPGFTLLSQLPHFSASKCFLFAGAAASWPAPTLQWIAEATGMSMVSSLESLPAALLGRGNVGATGLETTSGLATQTPTPPTAPIVEQEAKGGGTGERRSGRDYTWADETPVQVPPPPVSLDREPRPTRPQIIDAGPGPTRRETAYVPRDVLRPLRPRSD